MNSYFNANYPEWQPVELPHHHHLNRVSSSPTSAEPVNLYPAASTYNYFHSNSQQQPLNYSNSGGYAPTAHRYGEPHASSRNVFSPYSGNVTSFPGGGLHPHFYNDHIFSASSTQASLVASNYVPETSHPLVGNAKSKSATDPAAVHNDKPVMESTDSSECASSIVYPAPGKVPVYDGHPASPTARSVLGDNEQPSPCKFDDNCSRSSTPNLNADQGTPGALSTASSGNGGKSFFPWMKSYTGE